MAFTTGGLDYSAQNFGIGDCFVTSGVSWKAVAHDGASVNESGGTKNILGRLINDTVYARIELTYPRTGTYTKAQLLSANGGATITMIDIANASDSYCATGGGGGGGGGGDPSGSTTTGPFELVIKEGEDCSGTGTPSVSLDTSDAHAYFKAAPKVHAGVANVMVQNMSGNCFVFMSWEMKMWDNPSGAPPTACPTGTPEVTEISRFLSDVSDTKELSIMTLGGYENMQTFGSFEIPPNVKGNKILCLTLWGNFNRQDLLDELAAKGYAQSPPW